MNINFGIIFFKFMALKNIKQMRIKTNIILGLLFLLISSVSNATKLSPKAEISLITCSPGNELYSLFGHSAIRVKDPLNRIDYIFNYGTFDFDTPNFYTKFAKGKLPYLLSVSYFSDFKRAYENHKRSIYEHKLIIDSLNRQKLWDALEENNRPENRAYQYDFLFDNCATRVRDIIENSNTDNLTYNYKNEGKSFRDILYEYLGPFKWLEWGISTILGSPCDRDATPREYMFIPDYLMYVLESAKIGEQKLLGEKKVIYQAPDVIKPTAFFLSPIFIFSLVALLIITYSVRCIKRNLIKRWPDYILFGLSGFVGLIIFFLWFLSEHKTTVLNYNILYFIPIHIIVIFFLRKRNNFIVKKYFLLTMIASLLALVLWLIIPIIPQNLPIASIPLMILFAFRSYMIIRDK